MKYSRYCYLNKEGEAIEGTVVIIMFPDMSGAAGLFHPDHMGIMGDCPGAEGLCKLQP